MDPVVAQISNLHSRILLAELGGCSGQASNGAEMQSGLGGLPEGPEVLATSATNSGPSATDVNHKSANSVTIESWVHIEM